MAFIDRTYFSTGVLFIPNVASDRVSELLDFYITQYEPECLQKLLGYSMWKEFTTALSGDSPDQKWLDLRDGVEFTGYNGKAKRWMGLTGNAGAVPIVALPAKGQEEVTVDVTPGLVNGTREAIFDGSTPGRPDYRGYRMIPERTGTGTMRNAEYTWNASTGRWFLVDVNDSFRPLEVFNLTFEHAAIAINSGAAINLKQSIIANYVYYWFMRDNGITITTGIGEVKPQGENSTKASPADKMQAAWMQIMNWVIDLKEFLDVKKDDYPDFASHTIPSDFLRTVNTFGF